MTREESKLFFLWTTKILILVSFFAPLIIGGAFYFPYIVPKTVFFQIAIELALFFYILLVALDKKYAPKRDLLAASVLSFFGVYVLSSILGANPARSFFGTYERMLSVVNLAHFVALFFMARAVFQGAKDWFLVFRVFISASVLLSLYGLGQRLNLDFLYHAGSGRIDSTIGNAAFVAGYLIFALFFAFFLLLRDRNALWRYFYIFSIVLNAVIFYFTGTRGAILGLAAGSLILFIASIFKLKSIFKNLTKERLILILAVAGVVALTALFIDPSYFKRFTSTSLSDATVQTRIQSAKSSWEGFLARPILGWGAENYNLVFDKYYNPKLYPAESWFDHAHNIIFDTLTATGAVGFAAYMFLLGYLAYLAYRHARKDSDNYWPGIFSFALIAAYFVQNVAVFDSLATYLPFFLFVAFAGSGFLLDQDAVLAREKGNKLFYNPSFKIILLLLPVFILTIYWVNIRPLHGSYYAVEALKTNPAESDIALDYFKKSLSYSNFGKHEIRGKLADYAIDVINNKNTDESAKKRMAEYAAEELERNLTEQPLDFRNYLYFASFLSSQNKSLSGYGIDALKRADEVLKKSEELAPRKPILYLQWAQVKLNMADYDGAARALEKAVALRPDMPEFHLRLAMVYLEAQNRQKASEIYNAVFESKDQALNSQSYVDIAIGFANLGEKDKAIAAAEKATDLDPSIREKSDAFIQKLRSRP